MTLLQEEKMSILSENKQLQDRLREFETMDDSLSGSGHRYKETRRQMDTLKEELFKVETCNYYLFYNKADQKKYNSFIRENLLCLALQTPLVLGLL